MASADQIKALIKSHSEGDDSRFYSVATQVAASAARAGQSRFAHELKELIDEARQRSPSPKRSGGSVVPVAQPRGELADLLSVTYPDLRLSGLSMDEALAENLRNVITEQRQRSRLAQFGLLPVGRVLLVGPPGTGKTATAHSLAAELHAPLFSIRLENLITKYMGETAAKLRLVFDAITTTTGVYLFDEVDALASERSTGNDVGEIRRILNSLLQFLDQVQSDSLIVATTNLPQLLDAAVFRRFDLILQYELPTRAVLEDVIRNRLGLFSLDDIEWGSVLDAAMGLSHADASASAAAAAKNAILSGRDQVYTSDIVEALSERSARVSWQLKDVPSG